MPYKIVVEQLRIVYWFTTHAATRNGFRIKTRLFLLLCLLPGSQMAIAGNGCVYGESPIGLRSEANPLGCVPDPRTLQQPQAKPEQPPVPSGHWETRWGAIAIDGMKGKLAGVTNYGNKQEAADAALRECHSQGGGQGSNGCKLYYTYYNQCAAIAWGDTKYVAGGKEAIEEANQDAMKSCDKASPNCVLVYNACSNPQWISH